MVVECTGGDGVSCTGCIYTSGNGETSRTHCRRRRPWYIDIASRLSRVECIRYMTLCKGWLLHSIKPRCGHGNGKTFQCRRRRSPWSDLPNDILISIASRLGRVECIRFMAVCKGWLHSIKPHGHRNHLKPCLLVIEDADLGWLSLYTPFPDFKTYKLRIPELKETIFRFNKDGWILLSKTSPSNIPSHLFLLNMLTGAKFDLPDMDTNHYPNGFCGICFTSTPGRSDFMVVLIRSVLVKRVTIFTYRPSSTREEKWTEECYENSSRTSFLGVSCNPIFYKEKLYCLDGSGHLGVFDPVGKNWTTFGDSSRPKLYLAVNPGAPPRPDDDWNNALEMFAKKFNPFHDFTYESFEEDLEGGLNYVFDDEFAMSFPGLSDFPYKSFMVDLEGEGLISVFVSKKKAEEVHIFRLDCCKMGWDKVDSLGMGELFVGLQTSISTIQVPYGSWNNLYFPGVKPYYCEAYSLETKAYDPCFSRFWRGLHFTWIELPMSKWESIFHSKWKRM